MPLEIELVVGADWKPQLSGRLADWETGDRRPGCSYPALLMALFSTPSDRVGVSQALAWKCRARGQGARAGLGVSR